MRSREWDSRNPKYKVMSKEEMDRELYLKSLPSYSLKWLYFVLIVIVLSR